MTRAQVVCSCLFFGIFALVRGSNEALCQTTSEEISTLKHEIVRLQRLLASCCGLEEDLGMQSMESRRVQSGTDPNWNVVLGDCVLTADCLSSPNFPGYYKNNDVCVVLVEPSWSGFLHVADFSVDTDYDWFRVDDVRHFVSSTLQGLEPQRHIVWITDDSVSMKGWRLCRTNETLSTTTTTRTTTSTTTTSTTSKEYLLDGFTFAATGPCEIDVLGCMSSPDFPSNYGRRQECEITIDDAWTGFLDVVSFAVELYFDQLHVNDVVYSGTLEEAQRAGLQGIQARGKVTWTSDFANVEAGWRICFRHQENVSTWTCTIEGSPCLPDVQTDSGPFAACTQMYSDAFDADGDRSIHNGHPWCITATSSHATCGPCSCGAGEEQSYETRRFLEHLNRQTYISCSACLPGRFKSPNDTFFDECLFCPAGEFHRGVGATVCELCEVGKHAAVEGTSACVACARGTFSATPGQSSCAACSPGLASVSVGATLCDMCGRGHFTGEGGAACLSCPVGHYGQGTGQTACELCPGGHFASSAGLTVCTWCSLGTIAVESGRSACSACDWGKFADTPLASHCAPCPTGRFQNLSAQTQCHQCHDDYGGLGAELWVTMEQVLWKGVLVWADMSGASDASACGCGEGSWLTRNGDCLLCGEGMSCGGMGVVEIYEGYFASADNAGSVWRCHGPDSRRCPGGVPGTCAWNRKNSSIACGDCEVQTRMTTVGPCEACTTTDVGWVVGVLLLLLGLLSCMYYCLVTENIAAQSESWTFFASICSQVVTILQMFGMFHLLSVSWSEPFATILRIGSLLNMKLDVLNLGCVVPMSALMQYVGTAFSFASLVVFIVTLHLVCEMLFHSSRFWQCRWVELMTRLVGPVGTIFMTVFVSVSSTVLAPFHCDAHPNGEQTVHSYQQIVCWNSEYGHEHRNMVICGVLASLVPIGFICTCVWVVVSVPAHTRVGDTAFLHTFAFLFFRFRPRAYWYNLVLLLRSLCVALVPTVSEGTRQLFSFTLVLMPCAVVGASVFPWATYQANYLDIATNVGFLLIIFLAAFSIDESDGELVGMMLMVVFSAMLSIVLGALAFHFVTALLRRGKAFQFFLCHHKEAGGGFTRLLKIRLKSDPRVKRDVFLDSDNLEDLSTLFGLVANHTDTIVVVCTPEILSRPWCVGEMTTARLRGVDTILVLFPDFRWPSQHFMANYAAHVDGILSLAEYGISEEEAQRTLFWLRRCPVFMFPQVMTLSGVDAVAGKLVARKRGSCEMDDSPCITTICPDDNFGVLPVKAQRGNRAVSVEHHVLQDIIDGPVSTCEVASIVDHSNREAVCTALIVKEMLKEYFPLMTRVPYVLRSEQDVHEKIKSILVVCSNGCFHRPSFVRQLLQAKAYGLKMVPVVVESAFRFPSDAFYLELDELSPAILSGSGYRPCELQSLVRRIFQDIAICVYPQDSQHALQVRGRAIANRLSGTLRPLSSDSALGHSRTHLEQHLNTRETHLGDIDISPVPGLVGSEGGIEPSEHRTGTRWRI